MEPTRSALISGAGIAGPALARWLLREGWAETLVERAPALRTGGYMIDVWGVGYDALERMGLLAAARERGYDLQRLVLVVARGAPAATIDATALRSALGSRFFSIPRGELAALLFEAVRHDADCRFGDHLTALSHDAQGRVLAQFAHGAPQRFDLAVGADGLHSAVRTIAFSDGRAERPLGYAAAAFACRGYRPRDDGAYTSFTVPGRQLARYALRDHISAFFFVFEATDALPGPHDTAAQKALLQRLYAGAGWECDAVLQRLQGADELYFDHVSQVVAPRWSQGRIALLGDAAHAPSLLAGQGAAFAMAGALVLAHALREAGDGDVPAALTRYEAQLRPFIERKQRSARRFGGWFAPHSAAGLWLRNQAAKLMGVPALARWAIGREVADHYALPPM
jgi:2-polyprenyl-6-methoxyphenol hydroxylase-like FAD-dependent oxidoreductase